MSDKIEVLNVNVPDHITRVDAAKYEAMRQALFKVVPDAPPGMTAKEIKQAALAHLPDDLFPAGQTAGWWAKCVQLDLGSGLNWVIRSARARCRSRQGASPREVSMTFKDLQRSQGRHTPRPSGLKGAIHLLRKPLSNRLGLSFVRLAGI